MVSGAVIHRPSTANNGSPFKRHPVGSPETQVLGYLKRLLAYIATVQGKVDFHSNHQIRAAVYELLQRMGLCEETDIDLQEPPLLDVVSGDPDSLTLVPKRVINARACVVCGRDDRPGQQRRAGFKCNECIGIPNSNRFFVKVTEDHHVERGVDEDGSKIINHYSFARTLGVGSFGKVKLCFHTVSDQPYAAKIIDKAMVKRHGEKAMELLRREVRLLKNLHHPNIVQTYEIIDDPDSSKIYIIMEYCCGGQIFSSRCDGRPPVEIGRLKKYIVQIARGLQYLHNHNLVHSDVKPENILLDARDNVKLVDFGISTMCSSDTSHFSRSGTPCFMPPEAYRWQEDLATRDTPSSEDQQQRVIAPAVDIWSFGVTTYLMAFGCLPFDGDCLQQLGEAIRTQEPPLETPHEGLAQLLRGMLAKDPAKRFTVNDVLAHPFLADIRVVKGQAVETVKLRLEEGRDPPLNTRKPDAADVAHEAPALRPLPVEGDCRGVAELLRFLEDHGPEVQIVRPNDHSCTLYTLKTHH